MIQFNEDKIVINDIDSEWDQLIIDGYEELESIINDTYTFALKDGTITQGDFEYMLECKGLIDRNAKYYQMPVITYARKVKQSHGKKNKNHGKNVEDIISKPCTKYFIPEGGNEYFSPARWSYVYKEKYNSVSSRKQKGVKELVEKTGNVQKRKVHNHNRFKSKNGNLIRLNDKLKEEGYNLNEDSIRRINSGFNLMKNELPYKPYDRDYESMLKDAIFIEECYLNNGKKRGHGLEDACFEIAKSIKGQDKVKQHYKDDRFVNPNNGRKFESDIYLVDTDEFNEINGDIGHWIKPYNTNDKECVEHVNELKDKNKKSKSTNSRYSGALETYTIRDPMKRDVASKNNLKRNEFFGYNALYEFKIYLLTGKMLDPH